MTTKATPQFKPMRSVAYDPAYPLLLPVIASPKLDGIRVCKYQGVTRTKSGKPIPNLKLRKFIEGHIPDGFDMEIIMGEPNDPAVYSRTFSAAMTIDGQDEPDLYVFDLCDSPTQLALHRQTSYINMWQALPPEVRRRVHLVEQRMVYTREELDDYYAECLDQGYEGIITKQPDAEYKYGKSSPKQQTQLKWKPEEDTEGEILSVYEGKTNLNEAFDNEVGEQKRSKHQENMEPNGRLGGFVVRDPEGVVYKIGPGKFTHAELAAMWRVKETLPGKFVKFRRLGYGTMTNGAARHGRALGFRDTADMEPS